MDDLDFELKIRERISREKANQQGKGLRLRIEAPDLAALPWEFLCDEVEVGIFGPEDDTHAAAAQLFYDFVVRARRADFRFEHGALWVMSRGGKRERVLIFQRQKDDTDEIGMPPAVGN